MLAVDWTAAEPAKEIVMGHRQMSARDGVDLAVMEQQHGIERILSFDQGLTAFLELRVFRDEATLRGNSFQSITVSPGESVNYVSGTSGRPCVRLLTPCPFTGNGTEFASRRERIARTRVKRISPCTGR